MHPVLGEAQMLNAAADRQRIEASVRRAERMVY